MSFTNIDCWKEVIRSSLLFVLGFGLVYDWSLGPDTRTISTGYYGSQTSLASLLSLIIDTTSLTPHFLFSLTGFDNNNDPRDLWDTTPQWTTTLRPRDRRETTPKLDDHAQTGRTYEGRPPSRPKDLWETTTLQDDHLHPKDRRETTPPLDDYLHLSDCPTSCPIYSISDNHIFSWAFCA
ncbi:hypothetical protein K438DRAFT_1989816 [Mycena galopus ATCC 62051]|nr:hypothetical protein K438DRAFT_1989816 [Mycena galopus ATCC 62051]